MTFGDLQILQGNINGVVYGDNALVVPHFDNQSLTDRHICMDDIVRPHIARIARTFRQQVAIDTFESPGINPCEHEWVFIGSKVNHHNLQCQNTRDICEKYQLRSKVMLTQSILKLQKELYFVIVFQQYTKMNES
jgi:hypothetical protein